MQNTKTEYSGSERTPVVLPEMEQLLPPLSAEQFSIADLLEVKQWALDTQEGHSNLDKREPGMKLKRMSRPR